MRQMSFTTSRGKLVPKTDTVNEAGGVAYQFPPKQALAQLVATSCFQNAYYATGEEQLAKVIDLAQRIMLQPGGAEYVAKAAIWARERGFMKDSPNVLLAALSVGAKNGVHGAREALDRAFPRIVDGTRMLRGFAQILRSGALGRKSFGSQLKRLMRQRLEALGPEQLFRGSVGDKPSLADLVKMLHPKPSTDTMRGLYLWLLKGSGSGIASGGNEDPKKNFMVPEIVALWELFKKDPTGPVPNVPWEMLSSFKLTPGQWAEVARRMSWTQTRMNLNTLKRHGVFNDPEMIGVVAAKLASPELVSRAKAFPYQLLAAYLNIDPEMPRPIVNALHDAMEMATTHVPALPGKVWVFVDVSGSMHCAPVTGERAGATTKVTAVQAAGLIASCILRRADDARVLPFAERPFPTRFEPRDSIMTTTDRIVKSGQGGTACSTALAYLNQQKEHADACIYVSDNQSWVETKLAGGLVSPAGRGSDVLLQWSILKQRCPEAKLVCIDLQPYGTTQASEAPDILNVGGFSDRVFEIVAWFLKGELGPDHWVGEIEKLAL